MAESEKALIDQYFGTSPPLVSKRLCEKAAAHNDELTQAERWLFLCQGIEEGQFLANPKSFTDEQVNCVNGYPPYEILKWNLKATMGLGSIAEVLHDYWNPDRTDKLSWYARDCIAMGWWTHFSAEIYMPQCPKDANVAVI